MTTYTEQKRASDFVAWEGEPIFTREAVTVLSGQNLAAGTVLGAVTHGAATPAAVAGNTGNGTIGAVTLGAGAKAGVYKLTLIEPATNLGAFVVEDPDGINIGNGDVGTAFSGGGLAFTLADGATDFAAGDQFTITVAAGSGKVKAYDNTNTDGSEVVFGVLLDAVDASSADKAGVAIVRQAVFKKSGLTWDSDVDSTEQAAAILTMRPMGLLVRTDL